MKKKLIAMILAAGAMLGAYAANVRVYVNAPSSVAWGDSWFCYAWDSDPLLGAWPGTQAVKTKTRDGVTWHYLDVTVNGDFGLIVGDGDGKYTEDLDITGVSDGKAYFITVSSERDSGGKYLCVVNVGVVDRTHGKVQLWENGPYWAETNIGADEPWDSGYYFWWGDTIGYKWENNAWVASDGSSSGFSFSDGNAWTYGTDIATLQSEGWITEDGVLAPDHDAAQAQWGGGWRMPTVQDLNDLCYNKCVWIWMTTNGVNGYLVRGKDEYSSASIFLPCTGYGSGNSRTAFSSHGYYWSSVPASSWNNAGGIVYLSNRSNIEYTSVRYAGSPIRPVQDAPAPANQWTSGDCTVTLDSEGTLTVSGTGAMADEDLPPWEEKSDDVKKIVIEDGVTAIGSLAFSDFREATSVQIGKDVARIGGGAFYDCTSLSGELALPNGLTAIGSYAFCQCQNLSGELLLPNGLTTVEMYAFFGCKNFTKVKIPSTVTNIGAGVFADCTGITDVYCHPNAVDLTWGGATSDFKSDGSTKIHVKASQLAAYQEKFPTINATFVGDLPELEFTTAGHPNVTPWYVGDDGNWRCDESDEYGWTMLMTTVVGPGKLSLELKSSSESEWNRLELSVLYPGEDDYHYVTNFGGSTDWIPVELNFDAGVHEVKVGHVTSEFFETKGYGATRNWKWTPAGAEEPVASEVTATIAAIDAIGEVEDTDACKAKIDAARGAYDALTDDQKDQVTNYDTLTAAEAAYAAFGNGGEPPFDVTRPWTAKAKAVLDGAMYDADGNVAGVAQLKVTKPKVDKKTGAKTVKVSGYLLPNGGKKATLKATAVTIPADAPAEAAVPAKQLGTFRVKIGDDGFLGGAGAYTAHTAAVGGKWTRADAKVYVDFSGAALPAGTVEALLPDGEPVRAKGGKWAFDKAASIKYAKGALSGDADPKKPNRPAMKLSYVPKTGLFKGSFKVYAIQGGKLKKFSVKVSGVVVDGEGTGVGKLAKPAATWRVSVR